MVSRNTTLVLFLGLRIGPACEAGLSIGMQSERVPPQKIKTFNVASAMNCGVYKFHLCHSSWNWRSIILSLNFEILMITI